MKAAVSNLLSTLTLNPTNENSHIFKKNKLIIPLYQREYKWETEMIQTFLSDINKRSKFLGNIILDEKDEHYELIDGQQRITTCLLTIACIHNCYDSDQERTRTNINKLLKKDNDFYLDNYSIPHFLELDENGNYTVDNITDADDIYEQREKLKNAIKTISEFLNELKADKSNPNIIKDFLDKLKDCSFLVLINESSDRIQSYSVEELFLDINEKGKQLDREDVFKGHCFKNYDKDNHEELKKKWIDFKKFAMPLTKLGYKDVGEYIYTYILAMFRSDIPESLKVNGKHYLQDKTEDETDDLLNNLTTYAKSNITLYDNLKNTEYNFNDLCPETAKFTATHDILKQMCLEMIGPKNKSLYPKLSFFTLIHHLRKDEPLRNAINHDRFYSIVSNYYTYMGVFAINNVRKSKTNIDQSIREILENKSFSVSKKSTEIIQAVKTLRKNIMNDFAFPIKYNKNNKQETLFLYSVIDFFDANKSVLKNSYNIIPDMTIEHFIYHDNKTYEWKIYTDKEDDADPLEFTIDNPDLYKLATKFKSNYLCIEKNLNGNVLQNYDIIEKIKLIREHFTSKKESIPRHIDTIIKLIENMEEYKELVALKSQNNTNIDDIQTKYEDFILAYFNEENTQKYINSMSDNFSNAFSK